MLKISALCCLMLFLCSCDDKKNESKVVTSTEIQDSLKDNESITYHSERIVIIWCPTDEEYSEYKKKYTEEEIDVMQSHHDMYITDAQSYLIEENEKNISDTAKSIGFVYQQDTIILNKEDVYEDENGFWWKIILFDGKSKPVLISPIDIFDSTLSWFFKKNGHLKNLWVREPSISKIGVFENVAFLDVQTPDSLIRQIIQHNENNSFKCTDVDEEECSKCKRCLLTTDSLYISYTEKSENWLLNYARIKTRNIPIFGGRIKIGMTWEEFLAAVEMSIDYESRYIGMSLEVGDVYFLFRKAILQEVMWVAPSERLK